MRSVNAGDTQLSEKLSKFFTSRRGNVAVMFALSTIPILAAVGAAVDFGNANSLKAKLDAAADSAAITAVDLASLANKPNVAKAAAIDMFNANTAAMTRGSVTKVSAKVTDDGTTRSAVVTYTAKVPTVFMGMVGIKKITLQGSSTASSGLPTYADFYLLLDNTPSMGVGATTADIATMVANTPDQCAFACHDLSAAPNDYYTLAKKLGVEMRIDVMRQATQKLMDTAASTAIVPNQFRMAIYTFGSTATNVKLTTIQSLTADLSKTKLAASNIDLMTVPYQNYASDTDTDFGNVISGIDSAIKNPGDGSSSTPLKYLFFVSDGVADRSVGSPICSEPTTAGSDPQTGTGYVRCQEPLDTSFCTSMKSPRHEDRGSLHDLSAATDQRLV